MLSDVWHLPTACMRPSIKIVCCSLYPTDITLLNSHFVFFTQRVKNLHNFLRALFYIISSSGRSFSYGLGTLQRPSVRPTVIASPPRPLVGLFLNLVRMFPSVSSCASIKKNSGPSTNMAAVGQLWFFLLSHLLRNYLTYSNETCLLCLPQGLIVQVQYYRQESSKIPMHAGCGKKRGKDYNSRGNPAKFTRDPRNVSRNSPVSANFTREFFMRDAWKYFPRKIDL